VTSQNWLDFGDTQAHVTLELRRVRVAVAVALAGLLYMSASVGAIQRPVLAHTYARPFDKGLQALSSILT